MAVEFVVEEAVETAITFAPWLTDIPVLGRILLLFAPGGGNDLRAQEALQAAAKKNEQKRKTRIQKNARYVLKASDAMQCVEDNLNNGAILLAIGKGMLNVVAGRVGGNAVDLLEDKIFSCIESKVLAQDSKRVRTEEVYYKRRGSG